MGPVSVPLRAGNFRLLSPLGPPSLGRRNGAMRDHLDWRRRHLFAPIASKRTFWIAYDFQSP
jgi:hypothetical protein